MTGRKHGQKKIQKEDGENIAIMKSLKETRQAWIYFGLRMIV